MTPQRSGAARIAIVGAGWFARLAGVPAVLGHPNAELVAICDTDRQRARQTAEEFEIPHTFASVRDLVDADVADGVIVAVSQTAHYEVCNQALGSGLHVLVEKPMVLTAQHAWDLVDLARRRDLVLMVGETFHYTSVSRRVRETVQSGRLGRLLQIAGTFNSHTAGLFAGGTALPDGRGGGYADPALAGGGQGHTQVSHLAGLALWTSGEAVTQVFAYLDQVDLRVDLVDAIVGRLAGGGSLVLSATGTMPEGHPPRNRLEYYGTDGAIIHDLVAARASAQFPGQPTVEFELAAGETAYPLEAPAREFIDLLTGQSHSNSAPGEVTARSVELLDAAYRSAARGGAVDVPARVTAA
jgi:predicted dehydrogenase